jgi:chorismate mutase/prephenate dehydratase
MEEGIEDQPYNVTRFFVIGTKDATPTGNDKTSILFFLPHVPGSLHKALETLARHNVNMTRIQSRPMRMRNWEYLFFVDIEGHEDDQNVKEALLEMEQRCSFLKRLGSYPSGGTPWD